MGPITPGLRQTVRTASGRTHRVGPLVPSRHQQHHAYFRRDSELVHFPHNSRFGPQPEPESHQMQAAPNQDSSRSGSQRRGERTGNTYGNWSIFFAGFLAYPLLSGFLKASNWAFGTEASIQAGVDVNKARAPGPAGNPEAQALQRILDRANDETKTLHQVVHRLIRPGEGLHAVADHDMIKNNPIKMSNEEVLENDRARLVRIVDKEGKTLIMLLAVDMSGYRSSMRSSRLSWCHDHALRTWMDERAAELDNAGQQADPKEGIILFCYTATSSGTALPRLEQKGTTWQECRLPPGEMPPGFPLNAFEGIEPDKKRES